MKKNHIFFKHWIHVFVLFVMALYWWCPYLAYLHFY